MAFIVEDGTGISNANSYAAVADARAYALDRGTDMTAKTDAQVKAWLIMATDYLEQFVYVGQPVSKTQSLQWPRKCALIENDGSAFPSDELPPALLKAAYQLVLEQFNGIVLMPSKDWNVSGGRFITEEKVDVLLTKYSDSYVPGSQPDLPLVDAMLRGLLNDGSLGRLRCVRI